MVTTVGTDNDMKSLIENFMILEHDAIAAYKTTIDRLESPAYKQQISEFLQDHERHMRELRDMAVRFGAEIQTEGDMKQILTTGKVKLADLLGDDGTILRAMSTNEADTVTAYSNACENEIVPSEHRRTFERGLADERRHKEWMERVSVAA